MSLFLSYILLGLSISAPMGPINAMQLDKGIRYGFIHSWLVGIGGMFADTIFMALIYFGIAHFVDTPLIKTFLWLFGFFVLCYTGVESIIQSRSLVDTRTSHPLETKGKALRSGFFVALSNPLNILFWLGIYGSVIAQASNTYGTRHVLLYSTGIFLGIILWDAGMAGVATGAKKWITPKILRLISVISGIILFAFGCYFGVQATMMILK